MRSWRRGSRERLVAQFFPCRTMRASSACRHDWCIWEPRAQSSLGMMMPSGNLWSNSLPACRACPSSALSETTRRERRLPLHAGEGSWGDTAVVVSANGPYEALSIAPYVYARHAPVFLAVGVRGQLDAAAYENLAEFQRVIIVGDAEAVADSVEVQLEQNGIEVVRLFGGEAGLSTTIAEWCLGEGLAADGLGIALDSDEAIALVAGACCGKTGSVLMLSAGDDSAAVVEFARAHASHMAKAWVCSSGSATAAFARLVEATS